MEEAGREVRETEAALADIERETDKLTASVNYLNEILEQSSREFDRLAQESVPWTQECRRRRRFSIRSRPRR